MIKNANPSFIIFGFSLSGNMSLLAIIKKQPPVQQKNKNDMAACEMTIGFLDR